MEKEDYISREDVLKAVYDLEYTGDTDIIEKITTLNNIGWLVGKIDEIPSVNLQEPKKGIWIRHDIHNCHTDFKCSACGYIHSFTHPFGKPSAYYAYCPNCGAKMESEE